MKMSFKIGLAVGIGAGLLTLGSFALFQGAISVGYVLASTMIGSMFGVNARLVADAYEDDEKYLREHEELRKAKDMGKDGNTKEAREKGESLSKDKDVNVDLGKGSSHGETTKENDSVNKSRENIEKIEFGGNAKNRESQGKDK